MAFVEPFGGKYHVSVHEHRTVTDWAIEIRYLLDVMFPDSKKIILIMDNLNIHKAESLYKAFSPAWVFSGIGKGKGYNIYSSE